MHLLMLTEFRNLKSKFAKRITEVYLPEFFILLQDYNNSDKIVIGNYVEKTIILC